MLFHVSYIRPFTVASVSVLKNMFTLQVVFAFLSSSEKNKDHNYLTSIFLKAFIFSVNIFDMLHFNIKNNNKN